MMGPCGVLYQGGNALFLEVMVQGTHLEDAPALAVFLAGVLEITPLHEDGKAFHEEDSAEQGKEEFLFGPPVRVPEKFKLLTAYYKSVAPAKEPGYYSKVDLRYRKQLVCKK